MAIFGAILSPGVSPFHLQGPHRGGPWDLELFVRKANFQQCIVYSQGANEARAREVVGKFCLGKLPKKKWLLRFFWDVVVVVEPPHVIFFEIKVIIGEKYITSESIG